MTLREFVAISVMLAMIPLAMTFGRSPRVMAWIDETAAAVDGWRMR